MHENCEFTLICSWFVIDCLLVCCLVQLLEIARTLSYFTVSLLCKTKNRRKRKREMKKATINQIERRLWQSIPWLKISNTCGIRCTIRRLPFFPTIHHIQFAGGIRVYLQQYILYVCQPYKFRRTFRYKSNTCSVQ